MSNWKLNENSTGTLTMEFKGDVWKDAIDKAFDKKKETLKMDGFREGNVPREVFNKKIGEESLYTDAIDILLQAEYGKQLEKHDIHAVGYPQLSIENVDQDGVVLKAEVPVKPEVTLGEYKNLEVESLNLTVTDEEVNAEVDRLLDGMAEMIIKDTAIESGDTAVIDFVGSVDGEKFEGGSAENHSLVVGSNSFIPGFEEQLLGKKAGEKVDVEVTFPEEYHAENLKGKPALFEVTVHEVKYKQVPELDENFVKDLDRDGVESVDDLKADIKKHLESSKASQNDNHIYDQLLEKACENSNVDIPEVMVETEINRMLNEYAQQLQMQGMNLETYYEMTNTNEETLRTQMNDSAKQRVKQMLVLESVIAEENFEVTADDVNKELDTLAKMYNMEVAQIEQAIGGTDNLKESLKSRKALEYMKENAVITVQDK